MSACPWIHVGIGLLLPALASGFLAVSFLLLLTSFSVPSKQAAKQSLLGSFSEQSEIVCFHVVIKYVLGVIKYGNYFYFWTSCSSKYICMTVITDRKSCVSSIISYFCRKSRSYLLRECWKQVKTNTFLSKLNNQPLYTERASLVTE